MGFKLRYDRPTPKEVFNWRIYLFATTASFGAMCFGYDGAFFGTTYARSSFQTAYGITAMSADEKRSTSANLTACYLLAAAGGAISAWPIMEKWGRVWGLRMASVMLVIGAILMTVSSSNIGEQYAGRVLTGWGAGAATAVIPTFVAETSPPPIRGILTGFFEIAYQMGSLVGFWINYGVNQHLAPTSNTAWRIPMAVQLIPIGFLTIGSIFVRESPTWLLRWGKQEQAIKNLEYLRNLPRNHIYVQEELDMARAKVEDELSLSGGRVGINGYLHGAFKELMKPDMRHRIGITFGMFFFQNLSGAAVINYYSPTLFASIGIADPALYTGIYGVFKAVGSFIFFGFIIDRSGRRIPWLISASVCAFCLLWVAIFLKVAGTQTAGAVVSSSTKAGGISAIAAIMIYSTFWSFGGNGLPWIVSSEIFPGRVRSLTGSFAATCQWIISYAATQAFPYMVASPMGAWGCFMFYACCCAATFVFTYCLIPETKGIPLECMKSLFSGPVRFAAWRQRFVYPPDGMPTIPDRGAAHPADLPEDGDVGHEKYEVEHKQDRV